MTTPLRSARLPWQALPPPPAQRGAVLLISLIILLVLMVMSLSSSRGIVSQEKMTGSSRESALALMAAESGLREAEDYLETLVSTSSFVAAGTNGLYAEDSGPARAAYFTTAFSDSNKLRAATVDISPTINGNDSALPLASYFIEDMGGIELDADEGEVNELNIGGYGGSTIAGEGHGFRIVSRGVSRDGVTQRIIRSYYAKNM